MTFPIIGYFKKFSSSTHMPYVLGAGGFCISFALFKHYAPKNLSSTQPIKTGDKIQFWIHDFIYSVIAGALVTIAAMDFQKVGIFASKFFQVSAIIFFFFLFIIFCNLIFTIYSILRKIS